MNPSIARRFTAGPRASCGLLFAVCALWSCASDEKANPEGGTGGAAMIGGAGGVGGVARSGAGGSGASGGSGAGAGGVGASGASGSGAGGQNANGGGAGAAGTAGAGGSAGNSTSGAGGMQQMAGQAGSFGGAGETSGGANGSGGQAGTAGQAGAAGLAGNGGAGGGATGPFVCNQLTGGKLIEELFDAGFESQLDGARWQMKWQEYAHIAEWANPNSAFWNAAIESACANATASPDRVVLMVFSWTIMTYEAWHTNIVGAVNNFRSKYPNLKRIDLMTQITGPNNMLCPTPPAAGETIVVSPELQMALDEAVSEFPGIVFASPVWEAESCADFSGGGPHLTVAGNTKVAEVVTSHFAETQ
jgi:hypothetical protein